MKKLFLFSLCLTFSFLLKAQQVVTFEEKFDYYTGYCPGDPQYDNWLNFMGQLDTSTNKFLSITMRGTYDMVGKTCSDKYAARQIADALYNKYDATILCGNDYWYVGTGCSDANCGSSSDWVELTTNQYGTCNCGTAYTIRPGITSPNWGGINTETCQWWYQNANQTMIAEAMRIDKNNNLAVTGFVLPDECSNTQDLKIKVMNVGFSAVSDYYIGFSINGVPQTPIYITDPINSEEEFEVVFTTAFTFTPGQTYDFEVWTYDPNGVSDENPDNDLTKFSYKHSGPAGNVTASDVIRCGRGPVTVSASANSTDTILWYSDATGGTLLKMGADYTTPYLNSSTSFYAESHAFKNSINVLSTGFHNYSMVSYDPGSYNGVMFDFKPNGLININGVKVQALFGNTNPFYRVYIKEGTYSGNESSASAWTLIFNDYISASGDNMNTIPVNFTPKPGVTYGIYITTDPVSGEDIWFNYGNNSYSTPDLQINGGKFLYGLFGSNGVYSPYTADAEILYSTSCPSVARTQVKVTINPKPYGSELIKGADFKGRYSLGLAAQPDVVELDRRLEYELTPPVGYSNNDHGVTWNVNSVEMVDENNDPISNSMYTFDNPTASANGKLTFIADNSVLDKNVFIRITYNDLGPYFCDTTVVRAIHVAPTPKPDFKYPAVICDGDEILFENSSSIYSGNLSYKWYFGDNDSSDSQEPVHSYGSKGQYTVTLVATSHPWEITNDTSFVITINEVPVTKFKITNACEGLSNQFTNLSSISSGTITYDWDFGDNSVHSSSINPSHAYGLPGAYNVTLKSTSNGCVTQLTRRAYMFATPVADFIAPSAPVCASSQFILPNISTLSQGSMGALWDYSDGNITTEFYGVYKYNTQGTYDVKLKMVSEFGCTDSVVKQVVIKPTPVVDFSANKLCSLDPTNFTNLSTEYPGTNAVYTWEFSDGEVLTSKNVTKNWSNIGNQSVTLKSSLTNGCSAEATKAFDVKVQPKADFTFNDVCSGETSLFFNKSYVSQGDITYEWDFGDLTPRTSAPNPSHSYNVSSSATFTVQLITKVVNGCDDTAKKVINVTEVPSCSFTVENYFVSGNRGYKFIPANTSYDRYEWYFGEGGASNQTTPVYQYINNGAFEVKLIARNAAGCECENVKVLNVIPSSVKTTSTGAVNVYPNPADNSVSIQVTENMLGGTYTVYNSIGQMVDNGTISGTQTALNTENLPEGVYMVHVTTNGNTFTAKVIVRH